MNVVYRAISRHLIHKTGRASASGATGAMTPAHRGIGAPQLPALAPTPKHVAMNWTRQLKRVFEIETCGGQLKIIANLKELEVIAKILSHLKKTTHDQYQAEAPPSARAPPVQPSLL